MRAKLTHTEINKSIRYAALIQSALLPDISLFKRCFPGAFILFRPRDVVSGDFYWFHRIKNRIAVVAADSTGHGVPGAFMSILGINYLHQVTSCQIPVANKILNQLREHVMKALNQEGYEPDRREGMDMTVCVFDLDQQHIEFSGANSVLIYIKDNKLIQLKGDRMPVGISGEEEESFSKHIIHFKEVDYIYLFSDGYPDQFGGPRGKKLKYNGFRNLLLEIWKLPGDQQNEKLSSFLDQWIGKTEQIDDILIIGINVQNLIHEAHSI